MKALGWIIAGLALLIVAIGAILIMNSGALLERAIEGYGSDYLGAPVEVAEVNVSLSEGTAAIQGLVIDNPPGFSGPPAFRLNTVGMTLDTGQLASDLVVLNQVTIDGANVAALVKGRQSNLAQIMEHLNAKIAAEEAEETEAEIKLIIDRFAFTNGEASVDSDLLGRAALEIPDVHLSDIGRKSNGATVGEVLKQVLEPLVRAVTRRLAEQGIDLEGTRERLEQNVRERAGEAVGGRLDRVRDAIRGETPETPPEESSGNREQP